MKIFIFTQYILVFLIKKNSAEISFNESLARRIPSLNSTFKNSYRNTMYHTIKKTLLDLPREWEHHHVHPFSSTTIHHMNGYCYLLNWQFHLDHRLYRTSDPKLEQHSYQHASSNRKVLSNPIKRFLTSLIDPDNRYKNVPRNNENSRKSEINSTIYIHICMYKDKYPDWLINAQPKPLNSETWNSANIFLSWRNYPLRRDF